MSLTIGRLWLCLAGLALASGTAYSGEEEPIVIEVSDPAPAFRLNDHQGKAVSLAEAHESAEGQKDAWVVLAFFPKADTPG